MKKYTRVLIFAAAISIWAVPALFASPVGSVSGTVKDSSGAVITGVKLTLTNTGTNAKIVASSSQNGEFQFLQLPPASYSLVAEAGGFKKVNVAAIVVQVDQTTRLDIVLEVGNVTESVQVEAVAPLLENDKSALSNVVDSRTIGSMPLNARQFLDLALLTPGTVPAATGTQGGGFNVAGARSQSNLFLLDGISNMDTQINSALNSFRITDAVQEFAVQTSVATAEFGRGTGAQVSIVTKSGSNQLHGSLFEYLRNSNLDAADFFTNKLSGKKNPLHRNQFGGTLGGPILRDKLFYFGSYEGFRQVAPQVSTTRVPTDAERAAVTDPISRSLLTFWPAPNAPGATNFIANVGSTTFDHTGLIKIDYNISDNDRLTGRWAEYKGSTFTAGALPLLGGNANQPVSRSGVLTETHSFTPKLLNEFRFGWSRNQTFITVQDSGFNSASIFTDAGGKPLSGIVDGVKDGLNSGLPTINIGGGFAPLGSTNNLPQGRITNTYEIFNNVSWIAPFGASKHSLRAGYHLRREDARRFLNGSSRGSLSFQNFADFASGVVNTSTFRSGQTVAYWNRYPMDFYIQDQFKVKENLTLNYGLRYELPSAIREIRNNATNFIPGVGPVVFGSNRVLTIDPAKKGPASIYFTQAPNAISSTGVTTDKNNFAPVFGLAYTPRFAKKLFGNDATVIRAGFRVGFDEIFNNIPANQSLNPPYNLITAQTAGVTQPGKFPWAIAFDQSVPLVSNNDKQGPGTPTSGVLSISAEDPNIRSAYLYQYNFGIQRRLGSNLSFELDYQGSTGHKLGIFVDQNQPRVVVRDPSKRGNQAPNEQIFPYPNFASVGTGKDIGNSNYNGGVFTTKYQGRKGIYLQGSYTLGKSIDYNSSFFGSSGERGGVADSYNLRLERGPSAFDVRHRAVLVYTLDLPVGPGHRFLGWTHPINRQLLGGWQVSGITTMQSGTPFTIFNNAADFSGLNQFNDRPDIVGGSRLTQSNRNPDVAFDKAYFSAAPPTGRVGTSGRNQYYGPGLANSDFGVNKNFAVFGERTRLTFRVDFFNLFNHTNFANPVGNQSSSSFGKITQTVGSAVATAVGTTAGPVGGPRLIQMALRLQF